MDKEKVDLYLMLNSKYFDNKRIDFIRERLLELDDSKYHMLQSIDLKDPTTMLLLSIFVGGLGIDRFFLGDIGMGILKLLTAGLCGVLYLVDIFMITDKTKEYNFKSIMQLL